MYLLAALFCFVVFNIGSLEAASKLEKDILNAHNFYRAKHGVPRVSLNSKIAKTAQDWANNLAKRNVMEHRPNNKYGENIYATTGSIDGTAAVKAFYDEIKKYNYNKPGFSMDTGHFTQVVWKKSRNIGCGVAKGKTWTYLVVNYDPPGNYLGQFEANVPRPK